MSAGWCLPLCLLAYFSVCFLPQTMTPQAGGWVSASSASGLEHGTCWQSRGYTLKESSRLSDLADACNLLGTWSSR